MRFSTCFCRQECDSQDSSTTPKMQEIGFQSPSDVNFILMKSLLGNLWGISVGTGDPELMTLKGLRYLQSASVVAFPAGIGDRPGIAETIIQDHLLPHHICLPLAFPYVYEPKQLYQAWDIAADEVGAYLQNGQDVAFACEGDISFYSTFSYLAQTLSDRYPNLIIRTIPGVTSPMAAAASLGIPLTQRDQKLAIIPAVYGIEELATVIQWADVLVLMKFRLAYPQIWQFLAHHNLLDRTWIVERASSPQQVIYDRLSDRPDLKLSYFSLMIVQVRPS
jgi:precorrin-2/cobalt-factor-2 C20-methyltransferase